MLVWMIRLILGPAVGPIAGGFIDQYLSWRWIFYISAMVGGAVLLADIFLLSETLYRRNNEINATSTSEKFKQFLQRVKFNPVSQWTQRIVCSNNQHLISNSSQSSIFCYVQKSLLFASRKVSSLAGSTCLSPS